MAQPHVLSHAVHAKRVPHLGRKKESLRDLEPEGTESVLSVIVQRRIHSRVAPPLPEPRPRRMVAREEA